MYLPASHGCPNAEVTVLRFVRTLRCGTVIPREAKVEKLIWRAPHKVATSQGVRFDWRMYVYPNGNGNLMVGRGNQRINHPVDGPEQAIAAFANLWRSLHRSALHNAKKREPK